LKNDNHEKNTFYHIVLFIREFLDTGTRKRDGGDEDRGDE
jgi:hypothetical protein